MAPLQALGNSQTARHEARGVIPVIGRLCRKSSQTKPRSKRCAGLRLPTKAGNAALAIALRWQPPLRRRSGRAANRARICPARPAAPSGSAGLRMGQAIATLPFLFSRRKLRIVDGVVKSGAADPQGRIQRSRRFLRRTIRIFTCSRRAAMQDYRRGCQSAGLQAVSSTDSHISTHTEGKDMASL